MIDFSKLKIAKLCQSCGREHRSDRTCANVASLPLLSEIREIDLDLETTGRDVELDRPWQIHAGGKTWVCDPGRDFDPGALEVCGIDDAKLEEIRASDPWAKVAPEVLAEIRKADAIVAYNGIPFDGPLLRASLVAAGLSATLLPPIIDPKIWAFETWPDLAVPGRDAEGKPTTIRNHKLLTVYKHAGGSMEGIRAHDAGGDCAMMRRVWDAIRRVKELNDRTLRAVLNFQERAAELQRADWERYGGTTPEGAIFLWLRTCRMCLGEGSFATKDDISDNTREWCPTCLGAGVLNHTAKRRGQPLDAGFCGWALRKLDGLPDAVRGKFKEVAG